MMAEAPTTSRPLWAFENIPAELQALQQWVLWRFEPGENGKRKKVPLNATTGRNASVTTPDDWCSFATAVDAYHAGREHGRCDGIGFVFCRAMSNYAGIDIDDAHGDANLLVAHRRVIEAFHPFSYIEYSPSHTGLHIITKGRIEGHRKHGVEAYSDARFFTFTGHVWSSNPIAECQFYLDQLQVELAPNRTVQALLSSEPQTVDDDTVLQRMFAAKNGAKAKALYDGHSVDADGNAVASPDASRLDLALCNVIVWHTKNVEQVERIWLRSVPGQRDKVQRRPAYRLMTIRKAFDRYNEEQAMVNVVDFSAALDKAKALAGQGTAPVGIEGLAAAVPAHSVTVDGAAPQLWTTADFALATHAGYVVKGLIAPGNVCALLGQPGAGKSTLAPYLAYAVAWGWPVFGLRTRQGRTLYLAAEDAAGVKKRLYALASRHGHTKDCVVLECGNLRDPAQQAAVAAAVASFMPTLVVLDTVAAAFAGMDENTSQDMGLVVAWARAVAATGAAVLLVHHPAKASKDDNAATARGHGSLNGTLDMSLILAPGDVTDANTLVRGTLGKNRNGTTARTIAFRKEVVVLGQDAEGDYVTTTLPIFEDAAGSKPTAQLPRQAQKALDILLPMVARSKDGKVVETDWRSLCDDQRVSTSDNLKTRREAFNAAFTRLLDAGLVIAGSGMVWLPTGGQEGKRNGGAEAECGRSLLAE